MRTSIAKPAKIEFPEMNNLKNDSNPDDTLVCHAHQVHCLVHCLAASEPVCSPIGSTSPASRKTCDVVARRSHGTPAAMIASSPAADPHVAQASAS
jgi:hypothetical protein